MGIILVAIFIWLPLYREKPSSCTTKQNVGHWFGIDTLHHIIKLVFCELEGSFESPIASLPIPWLMTSLHIFLKKERKKETVKWGHFLLSIAHRIKSKYFTLVFKTLHGVAPPSLFSAISHHSSPTPSLLFTVFQPHHLLWILKHDRLFPTLSSSGCFLCLGCLPTTGSIASRFSFGVISERPLFPLHYFLP